MVKATLREKHLQDTIALLKGQLPSPQRSDLLRCRFEPYFLGERPGQAGVLIPIRHHGCPSNYTEKMVYEITLEDSKNPWWRRV